MIMIRMRMITYDDLNGTSRSPFYANFVISRYGRPYFDMRYGVLYPYPCIPASVIWPICRYGTYVTSIVSVTVELGTNSPVSPLTGTYP